MLVTIMFAIPVAHRTPTIVLGALLFGGLLIHALMLCSGIGMFLSCPIAQSALKPTQATTGVTEQLAIQNLSVDTTNQNETFNPSAIEELYSSGILNPKNPHRLA